MKNKKIKIIFLLAVFIFSISLFFLSKRPIEYTEVTLENDMTELTSKSSFISDNSNAVGLLKFADQNVLVMHGTDNSYYLNHDENGNHRIYGSVFLDYRINPKTSKKLILYGHNGIKQHPPFKSLENYLEKSYFDNNSTISYNDMEYSITMICIIKDDYYYTTKRDDNLPEQVQYLSKYAIYKRDNESINNMIVLQTCSEIERGSFIVLVAVN